MAPGSSSPRTVRQDTLRPQPSALAAQAGAWLFDESPAKGLISYGDKPLREKLSPGGPMPLCRNLYQTPTPLPPGPCGVSLPFDDGFSDTANYF